MTYYEKTIATSGCRSLELGAEMLSRLLVLPCGCATEVADNDGARDEGIARGGTHDGRAAAGPLGGLCRRRSAPA